MFRSRKQVKLDLLLRPFKGKLHEKTLRSYQQYSAPPAPLAFPLHPRQPDYALNPLGPLTRIPFHVERTNSGNLPLYYKYQDGYKNPRTLLRKIQGDIDTLVEEVKKVTSNAPIRVKVGRIQIDGKHKESLEEWLNRLGF